MRPRERAGDLRAAVVAVGTELVVGDAVDTNSAWLARRLTELGVAVRHHVSVGDDRSELTRVLRDAVAGHDIVVVSGGIGPTPDDLTRFAVARVAGVALERRADLADGLRAFFAERGRSMPEANLVQADLPAGAQALPPIGTAPGFALDIDDAVVVCVPGVPSEMRAMTEDSVVPLLRGRGGLAVTISRTVHTAGVAESEVAHRCADVVAGLTDPRGPTIAFLASRGQTRVRVSARGPDAQAAHALVDPVVDAVVDRLGRYVVGLDDEGVEHAVARLLEQRGWTLAVAESITGGGVGARLVTVPGASTWFAGGVITYATASKSLLADVPDALLARHGPVSEPTALALADGVRTRLGTDVALSVVGVAGPTTQGGVPVGTVCVASVLPTGHAERTLHLPPRARVDVQQFGATAALEHLRRRLAAGEPS